MNRAVFFDAAGLDTPLGYDENVIISRVQGATYGVQARWNFGN